MKSNKCVILIPIYKEKICCEEYMIISNIIKIFNDKYDIFFMCSNELNTYNYDKLFNIKYRKYNYNNIDQYSQILLNKNFYKEYLQYDYMLISQHDSYIFNENLLEYYINKKYPYIGALFNIFSYLCIDFHIHWDLINKTIEYLYLNNGCVKDLKNVMSTVKVNRTEFNYLGMNGGLSLRRIDLLYNLLNKYNLCGIEDQEISKLLYNLKLFDDMLIKDIINFSSIDYYTLDIYKKYNIIPFGSHKTYKDFIENYMQ